MIFVSILLRVGGKEIEVVVMNSLTVNVNLMMVPFYRPTSAKHKILIEGKAFPSDHVSVVHDSTKRLCT